MNAKEILVAFAPVVVPVAYIAPAIIMAFTAPELVIWYLLWTCLFRPDLYNQRTVRV
jgi:hypothetical protein